MDLIDILTKVSVKIDCKSESHDEHGTGTIICDDGDYYVMTAGHCLKKDNDSFFSIDEITITSVAYDEPVVIPVIEIVKGSDFSEEMDFALIRIEKPSIDYNYWDLVKRCDILLKEESYFCYGFNENNPDGKQYNLLHNGKNQWHLVSDIITNQPIPAMKIMEGDSGAGVFFKKADVLFCVGYLKMLNHIQGVGNDVIVYPTSRFNKMLSEHTKANNFFNLVETWTAIQAKKDEDDLREVYRKENIEYLQNLDRKMGILYPRPNEKDKKVKQFLRHYTNGLMLQSEIAKTQHISELLADSCNIAFESVDEYRSEYFDSSTDARNDLQLVKSKLEQNIERVLDMKDYETVISGYANYNIAERLLICSLNYKSEKDD